MLNRIIIQGRLTKDPELKYTQSQLPVVSFSVACERDYKAEGSDRREVDFINCTAWRKTAEFVTKYFTKGSMILVSGRLQARGWKDKDGNERRTFEIVADSVNFCGGKNDDAGGSGSEAGPGSGSTQQERWQGRDNYGAAQGAGSSFSELEDANDGDLPF